MAMVRRSCSIIHRGCLAIIIVPFWFICKKAGFSPWLSLLNIVPLGNLILIYVLAFAEWKVVPVPQVVCADHRRIRRCRRSLRRRNAAMAWSLAIAS